MTDAYLLREKDLERFIAALAKGRDLYGPVEEDGTSYFTKVERPKDMALPDVNTVTPAKESRLPRDSPFMALEWKKHQVRPADAEPLPERVYFGVRPCDAAQSRLLDAIFLADPVDDVYQAHRDSLLVVSLACEKAGYYCFCPAVGGSPHGREGADIFLARVKDGYLVDVVSEKGGKEIKKAEKLLKKAPDAVLEEEKSNTDKALKTFTQGPELSDDLPQKLIEKWDDPIWEQNGAKCIGCGVCTYLCPTCYCFDVKDSFNELAGKGRRLRCWDACTMKSFTKMAGGHTPRDKQSERIRQRIAHKFSYIPEKYGFYGCTGCGRCTKHCPVDVNLLGILEELEK